MNMREKNEKTKIEINLFIYEQKNHQPYRRAKMIYNQYHNGKSIIIDDLKYLLLKDPEGCYKIARSLVEAKTDKGLEIEPNKYSVNMKTCQYMKTLFWMYISPRNIQKIFQSKCTVI